MTSGPFLRRVRIRNYKSIAACDVGLDRLTFLVGPNGAGKSNFLDAVRFVADSLRASIDHALRDRGTIKEVRRRSAGHPNHFAIRLDFMLPSGQAGHYSFRVGARPSGAFEVQDEECVLASRNALEAEHSFRVKSGEVIASSVTTLPAALSDRLFLVAASGIPEFRPVYDALSRIEVYNLNPDVIRAMQKPDPGDLLRRDGANAASVFQQFSPEAREAVRDDLSRIVPGITDLEPKILGAQETIEFRQPVLGTPTAWRFPAGAMSDGTLRAFGVLLAIYQALRPRMATLAPLLVGLEEPEVALHPAAAGVLLSALRRGSAHTQIVVTSHSPDLLDNPDINAEQILSVMGDNGQTRIGPVDAAGARMLRERLFTVGELLRSNQIGVADDVLDQVREDRQLKLFDLDPR